MVERPFRFGVVVGQVESGTQWTDFARRVEDTGFDTLLMPDTVNAIAPFAGLAGAAAVTTDLRLGTFVLAAPLRPAAAIAWETTSIDLLCDGRFELGIGAGRPDAAREAELFGLPFGTPGERVAQVADTLRVVRKSFDGPLMLAAAGTRMLGLAAREADIVNLALPPTASEAEVAARVDVLRELAGPRFGELELCYNTFSVGAAALPPWLAAESERLTDNKALAVLTGSPAEIADVLLRRRTELGISYVAVNFNAMAAFVPVIELLAGK